MSSITPLKMPKWGLSMDEGKIVEWWVKEGDAISEGADLVDIETSKITNVFEAPEPGTLRRIVAQPGETLPVGALIGVLAGDGASDGDVDAFVEDFNANFVPEEASDEQAGAAIEVVEVAGKPIRVASLATEMDGDPVVFVHGFGGDLNNWLLLMDKFAGERPVYSIELLGHGQSDKSVESGDLAELGAGVLGAIDALKLNTFHLAGHSLGGAVVLSLASRLEGRLASLNLVCPAGMPGGALNADYLNGFIEARRARDLRPWAELLFADAKLVTKDLLEELVRAKRLDGAKEALTKIKDRMTGSGAFESTGTALAALTVPTVVIASHQDKIVGAPDELQIPQNAKVVWIDEAGHMPHLETAGKVFETLHSNMAS